jgi:hypothetical protein
LGKLSLDFFSSLFNFKAKWSKTAPNKGNRILWTCFITWSFRLSKVNLKIYYFIHSTFSSLFHLVDESLFRQISFYDFSKPGKITSTKFPRPPKKVMFFFFTLYFLHDHIYTAFPARETAFPKSTWIFGTPCLIFSIFSKSAWIKSTILSAWYSCFAYECLNVLSDIPIFLRVLRNTVLRPDIPDFHYSAWLCYAVLLAWYSCSSKDFLGNMSTVLPAWSSRAGGHSCDVIVLSLIPGHLTELVIRETHIRAPMSVQMGEEPISTPLSLYVWARNPYPRSLSANMYKEPYPPT